MPCKETLTGKLDSDVCMFFLHGFGGSNQQWKPQIQAYSKLFTICLIELPGHGENILDDVVVELDFKLEKIINEICLILHTHQRKINIAIAHSYGCSLMLQVVQKCSCLISFLYFCSPCLCPSPKFSLFKALAKLPCFLIDFVRYLDIELGFYVKRAIFNQKNVKLLEKQIMWNRNFRTVFLKPMVSVLKWPELEKIQFERPIKIFAITGKNDQVTPLKDVEKALEFFMHELLVIDRCGHQVPNEEPGLTNANLNQLLQRELGLQVNSFSMLSNGITSSTLKCPNKNMDKWFMTENFGKCFQNFLPMKMPVSQHPVMDPLLFERIIPQRPFALVDVSPGEPSYCSDSLCYPYKKIDLESKKIPSDELISEFVDFVDGLLENDSNYVIGIHCNYGYNRTGYFLCCYLILRLGYSVEEALEIFSHHRAPGIRHQHYIDSLFIRFKSFSIKSSFS